MRFLPVLAAAMLASLAPAQLTCSSTLHAASCGPTLTATYTPLAGGNMRIELLGQGMHQDAIMALGFGTAPLNLALPGGCSVLVDQVWSELHITRADGSFSWGRSWPHWATIYFYMQMASIEIHPTGGWSVLTTECQFAGCM